MHECKASNRNHKAGDDRHEQLSVQSLRAPNKLDEAASFVTAIFVFVHRGPGVLERV